MLKYEKEIYDELTSIITEDGVDIERLKNSPNSFNYFDYMFKYRNVLTDKLIDYCFDNNVILGDISTTESIFNGDAYTMTDAHEITYYFDLHPKLWGLFELNDDLIINHFIDGNYKEYLPYVIKQLSDINIIFDRVPYSSLARWKNLIKQLDDDSLIRCFNISELKELRVDIVSLMHDIDVKKKYYDQLSKSDKFQVALDFKSDEVKSIAKPGSDEFNYNIDELPDEEKDLYLSKYHIRMNDEYLGRAVASFKSDELMMSNFRYLKTNKSRVYFFINANPNLRNNEYFKNIINSIKGESNIRQLIHTLFRMPNYSEDKELMLSLLNKIHNPFYLYNLYSDNNFIMCIDNDYSNNLLSRMGEMLIKKYIRENTGDLYDYHPLLYIKDMNIIYNELLLMNHNDLAIDAPYNDDMLPLIELLSVKLNLNKEHLISMVKAIGFRLLTQLENANIRDAINLNDEDFDKYIKMINIENTKVDRSNLSSITDLLLNKNFGIDKPEEANIFHITLQEFAENNLGTVNSLIHKVFITVDKDKNKIRAYYDIVTDENKDYITENDIVDGIKKDDKEVISFYRELCKEYVNKRKNDYIADKSDSFLNNIAVPMYETNGLIKALFKIYSEKEAKDLILKHAKDVKNYDNYKPLLQDEVLDEIIKFKKNPQYELDPSFKKKYLKQFGVMIKDILENTNLKDARINNGINVTTEIIPKRSKAMTLLSIMSDINVGELRETVFSNNELYEELLKAISSYKLLGWPDVFENYPDSLSIDIMPDVIASYISNYSSISEEAKHAISNGDTWTLLDNISSAEARVSDSNIYAILFGVEDYRLIRNNRPPNSACMSKNQRISEAIELLKVMYNRSKIAVPPVDKDYELSSDKKINVLLGNTNDMINLTYGERTGACMRIGGVGVDLFKYCLGNDNGFHISFNDPETGKLISRISCFRNGNTLFMNELREPLDKRYTREDLHEACRLIGKEIIELTKNSKYPIQNVIAAAKEAFLNCGEKVDVTPKEGISERIYTDIDPNKAVIVATAGEGLSPFIYGEKKVEKYDVGRAPVRKHDNVTAGNAVAHIEALDNFYDNIPIDQIEYEIKDIEVAYTGEDWYVAITREGEVISYVQRNSRNPEIANKEMNKYELIVRQILENRELEETPEVSGKGRAM